MTDGHSATQCDMCVCTEPGRARKGRATVQQASDTVSLSVCACVYVCVSALCVLGPPEEASFHVALLVCLR